MQNTEWFSRHTIQRGLSWLAAFLAAWAGMARAASPFAVTASVSRVEGSPELRLAVQVPEGHYLYADVWSVRLDGVAATPLAPVPVKRVFDPLIDADREVFGGSFTARYALAASKGDVTVGLQGCSGTICFAPETHAFVWSDGEIRPVAEPSSAPDAAGDGVDAAWLQELRITSSASGYMKAETFLAFLAGDRQTPVHRERPVSGFAAFTRDPAQFLRARGWWLTALLIVLGGLLLNLTPCVLPMIPINLALIGAGAQNGSRGRGFLLGGIYGLGMALAYGVLGLTVVATGGFFGALQSSPVFNLAIGAIFVGLALALFDVFPIDFTRFQGGHGPAGRGAWLALSMGAMAALLAGACVAPVVIAVLLLAGRLHGEGVPGALLLPFLLGVGMALPWPFAGGGLAFLPKPGGWMKIVKNAFGLGVLLMALYYGRLAWQGFHPAATPAGDGIAAGDRAAWNARLAEARATGKPVLLDFWATWCKNCHAMSRTTLRDPAVVEALKGFVFLPVQAERPAEEPARSHLQALGVSGLPTYLILEAAAAGDRR
jgi:thiol:disulfide interchange protein